MNDWMTMDEAWWYTLGRATPINGVIVHSANRSNYRAWFVPNDGTVNDGIDVRDEEGVADEGGVWFLREVPMEMALCAFKEYFEAELNKAKNDVRYCEERLKELECGNWIEDDAE